MVKTVHSYISEAKISEAPKKKLNMALVVRHFTSAEWKSKNPILLSGELGYETDTSGYKMGDGVTPWILLPYRANSNKIEILEKDVNELKRQVAEMGALDLDELKADMLILNNNQRWKVNE